MVSYGQKTLVVIAIGLLGVACTGGDKANGADGSMLDSGPTGEGGCVEDDGGTDSDGDGGVDGGVIPAQGMVLIPASPANGVTEPFYIDIYEASLGNGEVATSRSGAIPWPVGSNAEAQAACEAAGKSLCSASQWYVACIGQQESVYSYGDDYNPTTCNGIDTYCYCDVGPCATADPCPYPHCWGTCGAPPLHLDLTGSNPGCTNSYGVFDMNGNIWEHVLGGDNTTIRGGAYNCGDSEAYHRCDYIPGTWSPSARGFRCCK